MNALFSLLAVLRAAQESHHHSHWVCKGPTFFADHAEFAELYSALDDEIDTLAEKGVHQFGPKVVALPQQLATMHKLVLHWEQEIDLFRRAYLVERSIEDAVDNCIDEMTKEDKLNSGLDNFLRQIADSHQKAIYKLGQRLDLHGDAK